MRLDLEIKFSDFVKISSINRIGSFDLSNVPLLLKYLPRNSEIRNKRNNFLTKIDGLGKISIYLNNLLTLINLGKIDFILPLLKPTVNSLITKAQPENIVLVYGNQLDPLILNQLLELIEKGA